MQPTSTFLSVRGLELKLWTWEPPPAKASGLTILLLHGFADTAASFDLVLPSLARAGHRVIAPDLRGFGDSDWIGAGGYYHFPDYLADVVDLLRQLAPERLAVVAHSMGGTIALAAAAPSAALDLTNVAFVPTAAGKTTIPVGHMEFCRSRPNE